MTFVMSSVNDSTPWPSPATKSPKVKGFWGSKFWGNGIFLVLISCNFSSCGQWISWECEIQMIRPWKQWRWFDRFPRMKYHPNETLVQFWVRCWWHLLFWVGNVRYEHMIEHGKFFGPIGFWAACPAHEHPCRCSGRSRPISTPTWTQRA